ncbi:MAG: hypothetical protein WC264_01400 [Candidatus Paceibacterota bacterium]|jgi:hypothetical protein
MKKNKGFGIGILIAIVAILAVGGVAYYTGKKSNTLPKVEENNLPQENQNNIVNVPVVNNQVDNTANNNTTTTTTVTTSTATSCLPTTSPWIKVLSPNGGETFTVGQQITVKWNSCNVSSSSNDIVVALHQNGDWQNVVFLSEATANDGSQIFTIPAVTPGNYKVRIGSAVANIQQDFSDNLFTINAKTVTRIPDIKKETKLLYNGQEYSFIGSKCFIQGEKNGSVATWYLMIDLLNKTSFPQKDIIFTAYDNGNEINSYLQKGIDIATKGVKIDNRLNSPNNYSTAILNNISVVWENLNQSGNNFSGNGYINFKKDIKPHEGVCNGTETVNQKYLTSSDSEYSMFCPSPVFPIQKVYFNCSDGVIFPTPAIPVCAPGSTGC